MSLLLNNKRRRSTGGGSSDPFWNNVELFLKGDGANGSTNIVDSSPTPKTVSIFGNTQISTAQSKYGGSSILFDGIGDYISANSTSFSAGTGDFCYEGWVRTNATNAYMAFMTRSPWASTNGFLFTNNSAIGDGKPQIWWNGYSGALLFTSSASVNDNNWHHIAFSRSSGTCRLFVDGILVVTPVTSNVNVPSGTINVGNDVDFANRGFSGYIDSFRVTIGVARYTSNFNPETDTYLNV